MASCAIPCGLGSGCSCAEMRSRLCARRADSTLQRGPYRLCRGLACGLVSRSDGRRRGCRLLCRSEIWRNWLLTCPLQFLEFAHVRIEAGPGAAVRGSAGSDVIQSRGQSLRSVARGSRRKLHDRGQSSKRVPALARPVPGDGLRSYCPVIRRSGCGFHLPGRPGIRAEPGGVYL